MGKHGNKTIVVLIGDPEPYQTTVNQFMDTLERLHHARFWKWPPLSSYEFRVNGIWLEDQHIAEWHENEEENPS